MPATATEGAAPSVKPVMQPAAQVERADGSILVLRNNGALDKLASSATVDSGDFICILHGSLTLVLIDGSRLSMSQSGQSMLKSIVLNADGTPASLTLTAAGGEFRFEPGEANVTFETPAATIRPGHQSIAFRHSSAEGLSVQPAGDWQSTEPVVVENDMGRAVVADDAHSIVAASASIAPIVEETTDALAADADAAGEALHDTGDGMQLSPGMEEGATGSDPVVTHGTPGYFDLLPQAAPLPNGFSTSAPGAGTALTTPGNHSDEVLLQFQSPAAVAPPVATPNFLSGWTAFKNDWLILDTAVVRGPIPEVGINGPGALIKPTEGSTMAVISAGQDGIGSIDTFFGFTTGEINRAAPSTRIADASAIKATLTLTAGSQLSFDWYFDAANLSPRSDAALVVINNQAIKLADAMQTGVADATGWRTFVYTVPASGQYTVGFVALNDLVTEDPSRLIVDNVGITRKFDSRFAQERSAADGSWRILVEKPVVGDDTLTTTESAKVTVGEGILLANDQDRNNVLRVAGTDTGVTTGIAYNSVGSVTYDPAGKFETLAKGEVGTDTFQYLVGSTHGATASGTVRVTIIGENDAPRAGADAAAASADGTSISVPVLGNDDDIDSDDDRTTLRIVAAQASADGRVEFAGQPGAGLVYRAGASFRALGQGEVGSETVTYTIEDRHGARASGVVTVRVTGVNDAPTAADDRGATAANSAVVLNILSNDTDPDRNDRPTVVAIDGKPVAAGQPIHLASGATVTPVASGLLYDPLHVYDGLSEGETASETFQYRISDNHGGFSDASVVVVLQGRNDAPVPAADEATMGEDASALPVDVLHNDDDIDSDDDATSLRIVAANAASGARVSFDGKPGGTLSYDPAGRFEWLAAGESTLDTVTYTIEDRHGARSTGTLTVRVQGANDAPVAVSDAFVVDENAVLGLPVMANDRDPDISDQLRITAIDGSAIAPGGAITLASGAIVRLDAADRLSYDTNGRFDTLAEGQTAADRFRYVTADGQGGTATAEAVITISGRNDAPIAAPDTAGAREDDAALVIDVLGNDDDIDSDDTAGSLRVTSAQSAAGAQVTIGGGLGNTLTYTPAGRFESLGSGETATDTITYMVRDRHGATSTGTVTVTITGANDAPRAIADSLATSSITVLRLPVSGGVLANDMDPDRNDTLQVVAVNGSAVNVGSTIVLASGALLLVNADGSLAYDPNGKFDTLTEHEHATEAFTYTIRDSNGEAASTTATIAVLGRNDPPTAVADAAVTDEDSAVRIAALDNDSDPDAGGNLRVLSLDTQGTRGSVRINADGTLTYDPAGHFSGLDAVQTATDTFGYTVDDTAGGRSSGTVTVTIVGIAHPVVSSQQIVQSFASGSVPSASWSLLGQAATAADYGTGSSTTAATHGGTMLQLDTVGASAHAIEGYLSADVLLNGQPLVRLPVDSIGGSSAHSGAATRTTLSLSPADAAAGRLTLSFDWNFISGETQPALSNLNDFAMFTVTDGVTARAFKLGESRDLPGGGASGWRTGVFDITGVFALPVTGDLRLTVGFAVLNDERPENLSHLLIDNIRLDRPLDSSFELIGSTNGGVFATYRERPTATDDAIQAAGNSQISEDQTVSFSVKTLLGNDKASAGASTAGLSVIALDLAQTLGRVTLTADTIVYDPRGRLDGLAEGEIRTDIFRYRLTDSNGGTDDADVVVSVHGVNDAPMAGADVASAQEDGSARVIDVLANDDDIDSDDDRSSLRVVAAHSAAGVAITVSGAAGAGIVYDPGSSSAFNHLASGETAVDTVTYTLQDRHGAQTTGIVSVTISGSNDTPIARDDAASTDQNSIVVVSALANDTDPDTNDHLAITAIDGQAAASGSAILLQSGASVVLNADGSLHYNPSAAFAFLGRGQSGADTFTYQVSDGHGGVAHATVAIDISGRNDAPVARPDALTTDAVTQLAVAATSLLSNDSDPDAGDSFTLVGIDAGSSSGAVSFDGHTVTYDPRGHFTGLGEGDSAVDTFTYRIADRDGEISVGTVEVSVRGVNDAPTANDDTAVTNEDTPVTVRVLDNDHDPDTNDHLSVLSVGTTNTRGLVTLGADGILHYDPNGRFDTLQSGQTGHDTFTYRVSDGHGGVDEASVSIDIQGRSDSQRLVDSFETPFNAQNRTGTAVTTISTYQETDGAQGLYTPTDGQYMARLVASGTAAQPIGQETVSRLEGFLGIPNRTLPRDPVDNSFPANGSAFKLTVNVQAGDRISFDWMFDARDFVTAPPDGKADDDYAVFTAVGQGSSEVFKLSDVRQTGDQGATGWRSSIYTANSAGDLTIGYAVVNDRIADSPTSQNSYLLVDNLRVNREFGDGYQVVDMQAAGRFETLALT